MDWHKLGICQILNLHNIKNTWNFRVITLSSNIIPKLLQYLKKILFEHLPYWDNVFSDLDMVRLNCLNAFNGYDKRFMHL